MNALTLIGWIVVGYGALVAVAGGVGAALKVARPRWLDQMVWMLEGLSVVLAVAGLGDLFTPGNGVPASTFAGYLVAAVVVIPVVVQSVREERGSWSNGVVAVAALAVAVVAWRIVALS